MIPEDESFQFQDKVWSLQNLFTNPFSSVYVKLTHPHLCRSVHIMDQVIYAVVINNVRAF